MRRHHRRGPPQHQQTVAAPARQPSSIRGRSSSRARRTLGSLPPANVMAPEARGPRTHHWKNTGHAPTTIPSPGHSHQRRRHVNDRAPSSRTNPRYDLHHRSRPRRHRPGHLPAHGLDRQHRTPCACARAAARNAHQQLPREQPPRQSHPHRAGHELMSSSAGGDRRGDGRAENACGRENFTVRHRGMEGVDSHLGARRGRAGRMPAHRRGERSGCSSTQCRRS